jgi:hypothetical protein
MAGVNPMMNNMGMNPIAGVNPMMNNVGMSPMAGVNPMMNPFMSNMGMNPMGGVNPMMNVGMNPMPGANPTMNPFMNNMAINPMATVNPMMMNPLTINMNPGMDTMMNPMMGGVVINSTNITFGRSGANLQNNGISWFNASAPLNGMQSSYGAMTGFGGLQNPLFAVPNWAQPAPAPGGPAILNLDGVDLDVVRR